jgi:cobalt-precorrin-5B (C1)-methyltransferase
MEAKPRGTRTGYTTGANATACTVAALRCLLGGEEQTKALITLPEGQTPTFDIVWTRREADGSVTCAAIKDAGDDPDATHKAELRATVKLNDQPGVVRFLQGEGVGVVTKPGLGLEVGGPAINPVPRQMMTQHALSLLKEYDRHQVGVDITVSVKDGERIAKATLNARLGILGGISILGRSGIVYPYSTAAYVASVEQGIEVAVHQGCDTVVLTTGGLTEKFAIKLLPQLPEAAFIQMGDYVGKALDHCVKMGVKRAIMAGQMGKVTKLAQGEVHTHARKAEVDLSLLAGLAKGAGATEEEAEGIAAGNTARHAYEQALGKPWAGDFFNALCLKAAEVASKHVNGAVTIESWLFEFDKGDVIGKAEK